MLPRTARVPDAPPMLRHRDPEHDAPVEALGAHAGRNVGCNASTSPALSEVRVQRNNGGGGGKVVSNRQVRGQQFDVQVGKGQKSRVTLGFTKGNECGTLTP